MGEAVAIAGAGSPATEVLIAVVRPDVVDVSTMDGGRKSFRLEDSENMTETCGGDGISSLREATARKTNGEHEPINHASRVHRDKWVRTYYQRLPVV